jgi:hypothetical protein
VRAAQVQTKALRASTDYTGVADALAKITAQEGVAGLYSGLDAGLLATLVQQFVYYYCYETLRPMYMGPDRKPLSTFWQVCERTRTRTGARVPIACVRARVRGYVLVCERVNPDGRPRWLVGGAGALVRS